MAENLNSYSAYCSALKQGSSSAWMMFELRNWLIREYEHIWAVSNGGNYIGLDDLEAVNGLDMRYDMLSHIVCESMESFFRIYEHMRQKNVRENIVMPVQKAREINSSTIVWLCRKPGRTAREKIGNSNNKIMAVNRFVSCDTPENRLLAACAKTLCARIQEKLNLLGEKHCSREELTFLTKTTAFLHSEQAKSISEWGNTPPNNALLSDRNYKKVWNAWTGIKELNDLVRSDQENLISNCFTLLKVELMARLKKVFLLPQIPLTIDYNSFSVDFNTGLINGCDRNGSAVKITLDSESVDVEYGGKVSRFGKDMIADISFSEPDSLMKRITGIKIPPAAAVRNKQAAFAYSEKKYIDIASAIPFVSDSTGNVYDDGVRIIYQEFIDTEDKKQKFLLSCFNADVLIVDKTTKAFTVKSAAEQDRMDIMQKIFSQIKKRINSSSLTMLINDGYDAFQLKNYKKSARSCFGDVELFPESIGAVFWYQYFSGKFADYNTGDLVIVADLIDGSYSITPVNSAYLDEERQEGFVWERYPTSIAGTPTYGILKKNLMKIGCSDEKADELLNASGLRSLYTVAEDLRFNFEKRETQSLNKFLYNLDEYVSIDITEKVDSIIGDMLERSGSHSRNARVIVLSEMLRYSGKYNAVCASPKDVIRGAVKHDELYSQLSSETYETLWRDHLPDLAIRRLFGEFPLIKNAKRDPVLGKKQKIEIDDKFTLLAGKKEYRFALVQNDNGSDLQYEAVIRNEAFPLKYNTECRLNMYYQYDADDVYTLEFEPVDKLSSEFRKAKVEFKRIEDNTIECNGLPAPIFPPIPKWSEIENEVSWAENVLSGLNYSMTVKREMIDLDNVYDRKELHGGGLLIKYKELRETKTVLLPKRNFLHPEDYSQETKKLSFVLKEKSSKPDDYFEINLENYDVFWQEQKNAFYVNHFYYEPNANYIKVSFFRSEFYRPEDFNKDIRKVGFKVEHNDKGFYVAHKIKVLDNEPDHDYIALKIQVGFLYDDTFFLLKNANGKLKLNSAMYAFHRLYSDGRSVEETECPDSLREIVNTVSVEMPGWYPQLRDYEPANGPRHLLYKMMCVMSTDMPDDFYDLLNVFVEGYRNGQNKLADFIGYALGSLTKGREIELLKNIMQLKLEKVICIFAVAAWKNSRFITNLRSEDALYYFEKAIDGVVNMCISDRKKDKKDMHWYLEYILSVFRLRELNDSEINFRLSLNNHKVKELYDLLLKMDREGADIRSILNLQLKTDNSGHNKLIYALVCYITGDMGENEILISSVDDAV